jgi:hypothetical protein
MVYSGVKQQHSLNIKTFLVIYAALAGGILGAKIPIWIANAETIVANLPNCYFLLSGRSLVGGVIGGTIADWQNWLLSEGMLFWKTDRSSLGR